MKKSRLIGALCAPVFFALFVGAPAKAAVVLDQSNFVQNSSFGGSANGLDYAQSFTAGVTDVLDHIALNISSGSGIATMRLFSGVGTTLLGTVSTAVSGPGYQNFDFSSLGLNLASGSQYLFSIDDDVGSFTKGGSGTSSYAGGRLYFGYPGPAFYPDGANFDLSFGTYMGTTAVPIPAAVWLFGSGLLGLVGMARRKA